ncbi:kinase-like protein [Ceratobasidium sp. AG-I]|nr:kinase-like protein [Ceratobasidium sp. AG-I]
MVAIKRMRSNFVSEGKAIKRTARELYTWSKLQHNNILDILGLAVFGGKLAMISPWMDQGSIMQYVERNLDLDRYVMAAQVVEAVRYLHSINVHGDLKGDNILVSDDGTLKLTDFGLTLMHQQVVQFSTTDTSGGTYRWMAPELIKGEGVRNKETDIYALGMTKLQIVTGKLPFCEVPSDISIINKVVLHDERPARPESSSQDVRSNSFWDLLGRCWVYEPGGRPTADNVKVLISALQPHKN